MNSHDLNNIGNGMIAVGILMTMLSCVCLCLFLFI